MKKAHLQRQNYSLGDVLIVIGICYSIELLREVLYYACFVISNFYITIHTWHSIFCTPFGDIISNLAYESNYFCNYIDAPRTTHLFHSIHLRLRTRLATDAKIAFKYLPINVTRYDSSDEEIQNIQIKIAGWNANCDYNFGRVLGPTWQGLFQCIWGIL